MEHECRGEVSLVLISPSGTRSNILSHRPLDNSSDGVKFTFMTVHHWGEDPAGTWTLEVQDRPKNGSTMSYSRRRGRLVSWSLILYGVAGERPNHRGTAGNSDEVHTGAAAVQHAADSSEQARQVGTSEVKQLMQEEGAASDSVHIQSKQEMATKQTLNTRRRKWLLEKGFDRKDVDFLIALFETEQDENRRKSTGENSPEQKKSRQIPDYRRNWRYGGSSETDGGRRQTYDTDRHSYWSKRNVESIQMDEQRIVDEDASDGSIESLQALVDELAAILEDE